MVLTRRKMISSMTSLAAIATLHANTVVKSSLSTKFNMICNQTDKEEEMYKEMYMAMITGISTFGDTLVDNVSTQIRSRCFQAFPNSITHVIFNAAQFVDFHGFRDATNLQCIELPICTVIYTNSFTNCPNLKIVKAPNCRNFGVNAFQASSNVEHIYVNNVDFSNAQAFPWSISNPNTVFHFKDGNYDYQGNKIS